MLNFNLNVIMKKYENPMLQVVSIKNDIITLSTNERESTSGVTLAPERFDVSDDWDAGY